MMMSAIQQIPSGFHTATPFILVKDAHRVIDFLERAFGARERLRLKHRDGTVWHAQVQLGDSMIMLGDVQDRYPAMPSSIYLYLPNADAAYQLALKAGGTSVMEPENQFYGDRSGGVLDPAGNIWWIATHIEDVAPQDLERRAAELESRGS
jgi:PhnB protein